MFAKEAVNPDRIRVKICGIRNAADAEAAIAAGADAVGFNCYPGSKRFLDLMAAADWISRLPPRIRKVAVLVDASFAEAVAVAQLPIIDSLQLHGRESPALCARLAQKGVTFAKALAVLDDSSLESALSFSTKTLVLDSAACGSFGGTGTVFPWGIARRFREAHPEVEMILAGGLTRENVGQAVREVRPWAVDVTTGVESSPGRKDHRLIRDFIAAARSV